MNYVEHANNNTLKTLHAMKYLMENANGSMSKLPKFIMKTDDDIYVNLPNLLKLLTSDFYPRYNYDTLFVVFVDQVLFYQKLQIYQNLQFKRNSNNYFRKHRRSSRRHETQ